jgi:Flp pilus assembly protein CpaB
MRLVCAAGDRPAVSALLSWGGAMTRHRRRAISFGAVGVVLAILALSSRSNGEPPVDAGTAVQVLSARRAIDAGQVITAADVATSSVPAAWASPHQLSDPASVVGRRSAVPLAAGAPLMDAEILVAASPPGSRAVAVRLDDLAGVPAGGLSGATADLYLVEAGRTAVVRLVLQDVLVIEAERVDGASVATLRVPPNAVQALISAESAGSLRLVGKGLR